MFNLLLAMTKSMANNLSFEINFFNITNAYKVHMVLPINSNIMSPSKNQLLMVVTRM